MLKQLKRLISDRRTVKRLVAVGGEEWRSGGYHRVYFPNIVDLFGLTYDRVKDGHRLVKNSRLDGMPISDLTAVSLLLKLLGAEVYYDVNTKEFQGTNIEAWLLVIIVEEIKRRVAEG